MTLIRPELHQAILRGREVIAAATVVAFGLWLVWLGGYLLVPLGLCVAGLGTIWVLQALRRMRFAQGVAAPGVVEVDEGQVGYFGPGEGGFVALPDLVELRLVSVQGRRLWRLKQTDGQALLIPVDAAGAERLFDAFASLPGMDSGALVAALDTQAAVGGAPGGLVRGRDSLVIWRRAVQAALT